MVNRGNVLVDDGLRLIRELRGPRRFQEGHAVWVKGSSTVAGTGHGERQQDGDHDRTGHNADVDIAPLRVLRDARWSPGLRSLERKRELDVSLARGSATAHNLVRSTLRYTLATVSLREGARTMGNVSRRRRNTVRYAAADSSVACALHGTRRERGTVLVWTL